MEPRTVSSQEKTAERLRDVLGHDLLAPGFTVTGMHTPTGRLIRALRWP